MDLAFFLQQITSADYAPVVRVYHERGLDAAEVEFRQLCREFQLSRVECVFLGFRIRQAIETEGLEE